MKNKFQFVTVLTLTILNTNLISQDWQWDWVEKQTKNGDDAWTVVIHKDYLNNIYCYTPYDTVIYISDTSFHHPDQSSINANYAISKYTNRGTFIDALDLYTMPGVYMSNPELQTDSSLNVFLSAAFKYKAFIKDTFLTATSVVQPDVFLAKLTPDYDLVWSGLITSSVQDALRGMVMSDDSFLYIACWHPANNVNPQQLNYLNQHTSAPYGRPMNTLAKIDLNGSLVWLEEIRSEFLGTHTMDLTIGENGLIYLTGSAYGHISINYDTIYHPYYPQVETARFITIFNQQSGFIDGYFFDWDITLQNIKVDLEGNLYISGPIGDTAVIGNDTIIIPEGTDYKIIGKFDSELNPIWYHAYESNSIVRISLDNQNLIFATTAKGTFQIADTILNLGNYYETIIIEFNEEGQMIDLINTNSSKDLATLRKLSDNCVNPLISGRFTGNAIFGNDTVSSTAISIEDGFIGKLIRNVPPIVDLGPDSVYCENFSIFGPEGYQYYSWNDSITNQNWQMIHESQTVHFACSNEEGCWLYDSINIEIHPGFEIDLGSDTTIRENDTIVFSVPNQYESYLWSNGSTSDKITIIGNDYGIGTFPIWIEVTDGPCIESDTLLLTIKSEFWIGERIKNVINTYPNPFEDEITVEINPNYHSIEIYDLKGKRQFSKTLNQANKSEQIKLKNFKKGIYLLKIKTKEHNLIKKIVKI